MRPFKNISFWMCCSLAVLAMPGCRKLIEVDAPIQSIVGKEVYANNSGAITVLTGIYASMAESGSFIHGQMGLALRTGLSGDELTLFEGNQNVSLEYHYLNLPNASLGNNFWSALYMYVFQVNAAIEGINGSPGITQAVKDQLLGEAHFMRGYCYFYLVNLFGDVPLNVTTDSKANAVTPRSDKNLVYNQVVEDLKTAQALLNEDYVAGNVTSVTTERVRPNKAAATALLARTYLYTGKWAEAEAEAAKVIGDARYELLPLNQVFLMNSRETIWALQSRLNINTDDAVLFNFRPTTSQPDAAQPVYLSQHLLDAFEPGDNRLDEWVNVLVDGTASYPYVNKYKTNNQTTEITEYPIMLRLAEVYLIRAEARAQQDKVTGANSAQSDLNAIRTRAGLGSTPATSQAAMLAAIDKERQTELFTESAHRWMDMKRRNIIDLVMPGVCTGKGGTWESFKALYPIPGHDMRYNPSLKGHQNPGYPEP